MQNIVRQVRQASQMMQEIAKAAAEQRTGIDQVGSAVSSLDQMTH
ncbi:hypothetical protein [Hydrogenophaga sp. PAMC20947]|nr:hypothetical protein [Hydrogenophaga sp. PAMC20947]